MMGFTPAEVRKMTPSEFFAAWAGFESMHKAKDDAPGEDEYLAVLAEEIAAGRA